MSKHELQVTRGKAIKLQNVCMKCRAVDGGEAVGIPGDGLTSSRLGGTP